MLPKIRTILYCTSLGPHAPYVFGYAYTLAKGLKARIVALHVMESLSRKQARLVEGQPRDDLVLPGGLPRPVLLLI